MQGEDQQESLAVLLVNAWFFGMGLCVLNFTISGNCNLLLQHCCDQQIFDSGRIHVAQQALRSLWLFRLP
jgi:hypothetical protein